MELSKSIGAQLSAAGQLEKTDKLAEAATIYQKLFDADPNNKPVIARLLILYRKLKDYKKELSVINDAIAAYKLQEKTARNQWIQSHPKAASAGKSMLRQLEKAGGAGAGLAGDPSLEGWLKRKQLVTQRITGKKAQVIKLPRQAQKPAAGATGLQSKAAPSKALASKKTPAQRFGPNPAKAKLRQLKQERHRQLKEEKQLRLNEQQRQLKERQRQFKEEKHRQQQEARAAREQAAQQRKEAAEKAKRQKRQQPSLFIIILTYRVSLDKIDAAMKQHMAYLTKHYDNSDFLVSGRQIPRTGGVILARASNRDTLERTVSQDPFVKRKLASADIIEFSPSQMANGLKKWLTPTRKQLTHRSKQ